MPCICFFVFLMGVVLHLSFFLLACCLLGFVDFATLAEMVMQSRRMYRAWLKPFASRAGAHTPSLTPSPESTSKHQQPAATSSLSQAKPPLARMLCVGHKPVQTLLWETMQLPATTCERRGPTFAHRTITLGTPAGKLKHQQQLTQTHKDMQPI